MARPSTNNIIPNETITTEKEIDIKEVTTEKERDDLIAKGYILIDVKILSDNGIETKFKHTLKK